MKRGYCVDCQGVRPFRRAFGWGTFFAVIFTAGFWMLALPFYPIRCPVCGGPWAAPTAAQVATARDKPARPWSRADWAIISVILAAIVAVATFVR